MTTQILWHHATYDVTILEPGKKKVTNTDLNVTVVEMAEEMSRTQRSRKYSR